MVKGLNKGDVFLLEEGMGVHCVIPAKFVYINRRLSSEVTHERVKVAKVYTNEIDVSDIVNKITEEIIENVEHEGGSVDRIKVQSFIESIIQKPVKDTFVLSPGLYVVEKIRMERGFGDGFNTRDYYPKELRVYCKALKEGVYDPVGTEVDFYPGDLDIKTVGHIMISKKGETNAAI